MRRALRFGLARLIFGAAAIGVLGTLLYLTATVPPEPSLDVLTLDRAQLVVGDAPSRLVVLPHTWALDGLGNTGRALYRIEFHLENVPRQPWGLQSPRLSSRHLVRLNGHWIHGSMLEAAAERRGVPVPTWVDIAPDLLQAGDNLLEIEVVHDYRAGLSVLRLGPESAVWRTQVRDEALHLSVPRSLNLFGVGLALFMLSIWWRRRSERALGLFAALLALLSVRNVAYSSTGTVVHTPGTDVFFYLVNVVAAMLLARFALAWAGRDWRWFRRTMDLGGAALIVGAVVSVSFDAVQQMRVLTYPLVLASLLPSLVLMVLATRREGGGTRVALLASVTMLCLAPLHDYFYIRGLTSVDDFYWMQYAAPIALIVFAWAQLDRLVGALGAVEGHAEQLERKVAERTRELELANAAKTRFLAAASHDLRQPVVSIGLLADLLRDAGLPPKMHRVLDRIGDSVQALNALLKGLLDLSRFDAGAVQARLGRVALRPLLESVVATSARPRATRASSCACGQDRSWPGPTRCCSSRWCATWSAMRCATPKAAACSSAFAAAANGCCCRCGTRGSASHPKARRWCSRSSCSSTTRRASGRTASVWACRWSSGRRRYWALRWRCVRSPAGAAASRSSCRWPQARNRPPSSRRLPQPTGWRG